MPIWHSLYLSSEAASGQVTGWLEDYFAAQGYTRYQPFDTFPGAAFQHTLRCFIAPAAAGWTRLLVETTPTAPVEAPASDEISRLAQCLSHNALCLALSLHGASGHFGVYHQGKATDALMTLEHYLRPGQNKAALAAALAGDATGITTGLSPWLESEASQHIGGINPAELPQPMKALLNAVNPHQANRMFQKLAQSLLKGDQRRAAQGLLNDGPQWDSPAGRRLRAIMACLNVPDTWREPDFVTLRTACALHLRRQRLPNAPLYPGDAEALAAVPNARDYVPVYGGKG